MVNLERLHSGDAEHFALLINEYGPLVMQITRDLASNEDQAEDLFQETWMRVYSRGRTYRGKGPFRGWLATVARNVCRDRLRSESQNRRLKERLRREPPPDSPDPLEDTIREEQRARLRAAITELPDRQRDAVLFKLNGQHSTEEIAEIMNVKRATVRSLTRNGVSSLLRNLKESA